MEQTPQCTLHSFGISTEKLAGTIQDYFGVLMPQIRSQESSLAAPDFLVNGDRLDQKTFHDVYESMPRIVARN